MYRYEKLIFLGDTDATGVVYFSEQFRWVGEAFELFLESVEIPLKVLIADREFLLPVVHSEGDYLLPLFAGDRITIYLSLKEVGTSSFTLEASIKKGDELAGKVTVVHVAVDPKTKGSMPLPEKLLQVVRPK